MRRNNTCYSETSNSVNEIEVLSKYFINNCVMDGGSMKNNKDKQSVSSDSQTKSGKVQKKPRKRERGQKDIREVLKSKKNELISYSKDFDVICKQSGIDVDSEQLQLAIALSKSLQDTNQSKHDDTTTEKALVSNQRGRKRKIRATLQEYGFKVPEIKNDKSKKVKRYRKQYKLLLVSEAEKQQIIADKYAQILLTNVNICKTDDRSFFRFNNSSSFLYNLSTNIPYEHLKDDEIFYINNLVEKSMTDRHHMLRDWSEIPGRPISPIPEKSHICFYDIDCTQEELSHILSGTIEKAQNIVKGKYNENKFNTSDDIIKGSLNNHNSVSESKSEVKHENLKSINIKEIRISKDLVSDSINISHKETVKMTLPINRSNSPDIFDDEVTIIMDSPKCKIRMLEEISETTVTRPQNDFMDLTECVGDVNYNNTNFKYNSSLSQEKDKTRLKPNDVMELTACVPAFSQGVHLDNGKENNSPNITEQIMPVIDLTQCQNLNNNFSITNNSNCDLEDTIVMVDEDYYYINTTCQSNVVKTNKHQNYTVDLIKAPNVCNDVHNHDSANNLEKDSDKSDGSDRKSDFVDDPQNYNVNNESLRNLASNKYLKNNQHTDENLGVVLEDYQILDAMDLTQSSNSEDSSSLVQTRDCRKHSSHDHYVTLPIDDNYDAEKDCNVNESIEDSLVLLMDCESNKNLDSRTKNIPQSLSNYLEHNDKINEVNKNHKNMETMDLTQSTNSEDSLHIIHELNSNDNSLNDTVPLNEEDYDLNHVSNRHLHIGNNDFDDGKQCHNVSVLDVGVADSHDKQSSNQISKLCDTDEFVNDKPNNLEDSYLFENDPDIHYLKFSIQQCNNLKKYPIDTTNFKELPESQTKCQHNSFNYIDNEIESNNIISETLTAKKSKNTDKCSKKSHDSSQISLTQCLNTIGIRNEIHDDINNDHAFDSILMNISKSKKTMKQPSEPRIGDLNTPNHCKYDTDARDCEIDLTQHSDCSEDRVSIPDVDCVDHLESRNDISINCDEIRTETDSRINRSITVEPTTQRGGTVKNYKDSSVDDGISTETSEVFEISDNEFNYSVNQYKHDNNSIRVDRTRFDIGGISTIDEFLNRDSISRANTLRCSCSSNNELDYTQTNCLPVVTFKSNDNIGNIAAGRSKSCTEIEGGNISPPKSRCSENILFAQTPKRGDYVIKTDQVTPMPRYEMMTSPERDAELDKYGIKPLKRKRAIQILTHIYNQTHPLMEIISESGELPSPSKIRKRNDHTTFPRRAIATQIDALLTKDCIQESNLEQIDYVTTSQKSSKSVDKLSKRSHKSPKKANINTSDKKNKLYEETKLLPDIKSLECSSEEYIFQTREKAKVQSCRVPLHIAFHNYVSCRQALREAILKYEPINIDDIHKGLVAVGFRYNPKDLLKFMDRKCITVKTADSNRNNRK